MTRYTAGPSKQAATEPSKPATAPKITRLPTPRPRFQPAPDYRGPFSMAGIGRDVTTGAAWGQP